MSDFLVCTVYIAGGACFYLCTVTMPMHNNYFCYCCGRLELQQKADKSATSELLSRIESQAQQVRAPTII